MWLFFYPCPKNLPEAKLKTFGGGDFKTAFYWLRHMAFSDPSYADLQWQGESGTKENTNCTVRGEKEHKEM